MKRLFFEYKYFLGLWGFLLLSRLLFLDGSINFFDSQQYIGRTLNPSFLEAISTGHPPYHPLYIGLGYVFHNILSFFGIVNPGLGAALPSAIFGSLALVPFYLLIQSLFTQRIALIAMVLMAINPLFWISNLTVLVDPTGIFFLMSSFYLYWKGINQSSTKILLFSSLALACALLTHTSFALWVPIYGGLFITKQFKQKKVIPDFYSSLILAIGPIIATVIYVILLLHNGDYGRITTVEAALRYLFAGNINDRLPFLVSRWFNLLWAMATTPLIVGGIIGGWMLIMRKKPESILIILWIAPSLLASTYIYENLHGRALFMSIFALATVTAYALDSISHSRLKTTALIITISLILPISVPAIASYASPAPHESLRDFEQVVRNDSLIIGTNTMRTWSTSGDRYKRLGDVDVGTGTINQEIKKYQSQGKPVYLTSDAVTHPMWRYDGQRYDLRSLNLGLDFAKPPLAAEFFEQYRFDVALTDPRFRKYLLELTQEDNILTRIEKNIYNLSSQPFLIGRLVDAESGSAISGALPYLYDPNIDIVTENIQANDIGYILFRKTTNNKDPIEWGMSDNQGFFALPTRYDLSQANISIFNHPYTTRLQSSAQKFVRKEKIDIDTLKPTATIHKAPADLIAAIAKLQPTDSFYITHSHDTYTLNVFSYPTPKTDRIEAEALALTTGSNINDPSASGKQVRQALKGEKTDYLTTGPYLSLTPGNYSLTAHYQLTDLTTDDKNSFDIAGELGTIGFGGIVLTQNTKGYENITIDFTVPSLTHGIELRTAFKGNANLSVDYFELKQR